MNWALSPVGLKLMRTSQAAAFKVEGLSDPRIKGIQVECIGPSGVGKTTIVQLFRQRASYGWYFDYPSKTSLRTNISLENGCGDLYKSLLLKKMELIFAQDYSAEHSLALIGFYNTRLQQDLKLQRSGYMSDGGTWWDDGIFRVFCDELYEQLQKDSDLFNLFQNRVVINCMAPSEIIADRLAQRSRKSSGAKNDWYAVCGPDGIHERIEVGLERAQRFLGLWHRLGGESYSIDLSQAGAAVRELLNIEGRIVSARTSRRKANSPHF